MKRKAYFWLATFIFAGFAFGCGEESDDVHGTQDTSDCKVGQTKCGDDGKSTVSCQKGHWGEPVACPISIPICDGNLNRCVECASGTKECDGEDQIKTCNEEGKWNNATSCPSTAPVCDAGTGECVSGTAPACTDGDKRCDGNDKIQVCAGGTWGAATACPSETPDCDQGTKSCIKKPATECTSGEKQCEGDRHIKECDSTGHWGEASSCPAETPVCDGTANACVSDTASACTDGEKRCDGDRKIQECQGGEWNASVECPAGTPFCSGTLKACTQCIPGVDFCFGGNAESAGMFKCNDDGTKGDNIKFCECNADGTACADTGGCDEGATKCAEDGMHELVCNGGTWGEPQLCRFNSACSAASGKCECTPGDSFCGGNGKSEGLYTCLKDKNYPSQPQIYCACKKDHTACVTDAPSCTEGARKCGINSPLVCKKGAWVDDVSCSRSETCNDTIGSVCVHNNAPATDKNTVCGDGETKCVNNMLYKCNKGLYEQQLPECDGSGSCKLMYCITKSIAPGSHSAGYEKACSNAEYCSMDGVNKCDAFGKVTKTPCGKSQTCTLTLKTSTITAQCVTKLCDELSYKCDDSKLSVCNDNRWIEITDCSKYGLTCQDGAGGGCFADKLPTE